MGGGEGENGVLPWRGGGEFGFAVGGGSFTVGRMKRWREMAGLACLALVAVRLKPEDPTGLNVLATLALREGDWARARELYEASLGVEARQPAMWEKLAEALERLGKGEEAARARARWRNLGGAGGE